MQLCFYKNGMEAEVEGYRNWLSKRFHKDLVSWSWKQMKNFKFKFADKYLQYEYIIWDSEEPQFLLCRTGDSEFFYLDLDEDDDKEIMCFFDKWR